MLPIVFFKLDDVGISVMNKLKDTFMLVILEFMDNSERESLVT